MSPSAPQDSVVTYAVDAGIAVLTITYAPVNALGQAVRQGLEEALAAAGADPAVVGVIIAGSGDAFSAGADIAEFKAPPASPTLSALLDRLADFPKPTLAAINGFALGGGLELALACRFRVARQSARLGLPEVKLGLIPGAGGTVRLPHLIGLEPALAMIISGAPVSASQAIDTGLVDGLIASDADLMQAAKTFLHGQAGGARPALSPARFAEGFEPAAATALSKARGLDAPVAVVEALRNTMTLPQDEALRRERTIFDRLRSGAQSAAQRHLFFAERAAAKLDLGGGVVARSITTVGIIGAGTMGTGIAMSFANAGWPVRVFDANAEALQRAGAAIDKSYASSVARGSLAPAAADARRAAISTVASLADLRDCDLVVEAAFEDMEVKRTLFAALDAVLRPGAILTTNTSYLDVNQIAAATGRPADVIGLHFFSPANVMKLLEVVRGTATAPDVLQTAMAVAKRLGKVPVVVGVGPGFVGNRMLGARSTDLIELLLEGATPEQVDAAFTEFGWSMGPFAMQDLAGLDISWRNRKANGQTLAIADALCEAGRFGQKTGRGYYRYEPGSRLPLPDPELRELIARTAAAGGIAQRLVSTDEIVERTLYPMINEGYRLLDESIAARPSDIDLVWVHGYGFPRALGGPMFWAEQGRLDHIVARLEWWHERSGKPVFKPAEGLRQRIPAQSEETAS